MYKVMNNAVCSCTTFCRFNTNGQFLDQFLVEKYRAIQDLPTLRPVQSYGAYSLLYKYLTTGNNYHYCSGCVSSKKISTEIYHV